MCSLTVDDLILGICLCFSLYVGCTVGPALFARTNRTPEDM